MSTFKDKAAGVASSTAKAAKYAAFVAKTKMQIKLEENKIRSEYTKLGKVYYKDYITDEEPDEAEYKPICEAISESFGKISEMKDALKAAKAEYNNEAAPKDAAEDAPVSEAEPEVQEILALEEVNE